MLLFLFGFKSRKKKWFKVYNGSIKNNNSVIHSIEFSFIYLLFRLQWLER